jgi:PAS domain S-box-containing protein
VTIPLPTADRIDAPPAPAGRWSPAAFLGAWWPAVVLAIYTLGIDAWVAARWDGSRTAMTALAAWGPIPAVAAAVEAGGYRVLRSPMAGLRRRAWQSLLASLSFILVGSAIWAYQVAVGTDDVGGYGDLVYWVSFPFAALAMALFFLDVGGSFRQPVVWLDIGTLAIAVGVAMWEFVVRPMLVATAAQPGEALAATVYACSFVLTTVFAGLAYMQVADWKAERALVLLVGAAIANVLAECFSGGETPSTLAATLAYTTAYLAADLMVVAAAIAESRREAVIAHQPPRLESATSALPALAILLAVTMLIIVHATPQGVDTWVTVGVALLGAVLVSGREISTRYEVHRRHRARAMAEAEERLTELIRRSRDVVAVVAADGRLAYVSPAAESVLGQRAAALVGGPAGALVGAANAGRMTSYLESLASGRADGTAIDFEIVLPTGERRIVAVVGSDERSSAVIGGIALTVSDATRERRAERALIDDAVRERQALSSEAHEGIAQELAGIALLAESLRRGPGASDEDTASAARSIVDGLNSTIGSVRRLAATLSPVRVAAGSLSRAIQNLAAELTTGGGVRVTVHSQLDDEAVPESLRDDAYRIVQAALTRAVRDPSCTTVRIELRLARGELRIILEGNGNRLAPAEGGEDCDLLRSITHRVQRLRGTLAIERLANGGARLGVRLPCPAAHPPVPAG